MIGLLILFATALFALLALLTAMLAWEMRHPPRHTTAYAIARGLAADPGELNLAFETWTLDRPDGAKLAIWEIQSPKSKIPDSLTAVFIHGWGHSRVDSLARIRPFDELCERIVMYDLRGHGETPGNSRLGDGEADDLLALLERLGSGPFILIGHSMGAVIAIRAAIRQPRAIAGVIAYGPYCQFHRSLIGRLRVSGYPARPISDLAMAVHRLMGVRPASVDPRELKSLATLLLVFHGSNDAVSPIEHGRRMAAGAQNASFVEVPAARHTDSHSIDAARHDLEVRDFIERISKVSPQPV